MVSKSGGHKLSLYAAMQSLYEKDNSKCLLSSTLLLRTDLKLHSYKSPVDEEQRSQEKDVCDKNASYGPLDRHQHFEDSY